MDEMSHNIFNTLLNLSLYGQTTILMLIIAITLTSYSFLHILNSIRFEKIRQKYFEDLFWSGADLSEIYSDLREKEWKSIGISERIFIETIREFNKIKDLGKADSVASLIDQKVSLIKSRCIQELYSRANSIFSYTSGAILITLVYFLYLFFNLVFLGNAEHFANFMLFHSLLPSLMGFAICLISALKWSVVQYKLKDLEFQIILQADELSFLLKKHIMR